MFFRFWRFRGFGFREGLFLDIVSVLLKLKLLDIIWLFWVLFVDRLEGEEGYGFLLRVVDFEFMKGWGRGCLVGVEGCVWSLEGLFGRNWRFRFSFIFLREG